MSPAPVLQMKARRHWLPDRPMPSGSHRRPPAARTASPRGAGVSLLAPARRPRGVLGGKRVEGLAVVFDAQAIGCPVGA
jgi:hypothetical protein